MALTRSQRIHPSDAPFAAPARTTNHPSWRRLGPKGSNKSSFVTPTGSQIIPRGADSVTKHPSWLPQAPGILRGVDWVTKHPSWRQQPLQASFVASTGSQSILRGDNSRSRHPSWRRLGHKASFVATTAAPGILRGVDSVTKHPLWRPQVPGILRGANNTNSRTRCRDASFVASTSSRHPSWR